MVTLFTSIVRTTVSYVPIKQTLRCVVMFEFFDLPIETQNIILIDGSKLKLAERLIIACEECSPVDAELPFSAVLDRLTGHNPTTTDYILEMPGRCPRCWNKITERTLVEPHIDYYSAAPPSQ